MNIVNCYGVVREEGMAARSMVIKLDPIAAASSHLPFWVVEVNQLG
jgi:hypothetical protein